MARPALRLLSKEEVNEVHEESLRLLEEVGVFVDNVRALELLKEGGAHVEGKIAKIPRDLVLQCLNYVPKSLKLYYRDGKRYVRIGDDNVIFNPGSTAIKILDLKQSTTRLAVFRDLFDFAKLVDYLEYIGAQSTALIPNDVPLEIRDRVRLYPILKLSSKPIITGAFTIEGVQDMKDMLEIVVGDVASRPIAIFDVCPSPPLKWSRLTVQNLMDCAYYGIPVEIIPMPQMGATAPVTIAGALVQHNAEALSGIVIAQLTRRGAPVIYGGSPCLFDMRWGTACISTPETALLTMGYVEIGKYYGIPTHAYVGLSDSKEIDYQAGLETFMGALLATMIGINVASGPGMLEFESTQSMEKLLIDNEACGIAFRMAKGFDVDEATLAMSLLREAHIRRHFLSSRHTLRWMRQETYIPRLLSRSIKERASLMKRARELVRKILEEYKPDELPSDVERELDRYFIDMCKRHGYSPKLN